ncbi:AraC family transcriptional regulator [Paenibacillus kandeliae]|uniref:AraC family transcriptional regulator n=1 Tax=Paenibacillus kandeliae TaxID=3231269 RepID=UPI00345AE829
MNTIAEWKRNNPSSSATTSQTSSVPQPLYGSILSALDTLSFRLRNVEKVRKTGDFHLPQQYASSHTLLIIAEGEGILTREQERLRVQGQSVHWFVPGSTLGLRSSGRKGMSVYLLRFDCYVEHGQELKLLGLSAYTAMSAGEHSYEKHDHGGYPIAGSWLLPICQSIHEQWMSGEHGSRTRAVSLFLQLLCDLREQEHVPEGDASVQLQRTRAYIEQHYREPLTLEQLAEMAGLSRNYYVSLFKKHYGESVVHYMTRLRMEQARRLMANPELRLRDIAHEVGYHDEFYFSRKFKQETGITPSAYIRNRTRKIASYDPIITGYLLALDVIPYAAPLHPKWTAHDEKRHAADIPVHLKVQRATMQWESNLAILRRCHPELIIAPEHISPEEKQHLQQIAEVHYIDCASPMWKQQLRELGHKLGQDAEAESWLAQYDQQCGQVLEKMRAGKAAAKTRLDQAEVVGEQQQGMKENQAVIREKQQGVQNNQEGIKGKQLVSGNANAIQSNIAPAYEQGETVVFVRYWKGNFYSCYSCEAAHMLRNDLHVHLARLLPQHMADHEINRRDEAEDKRNERDDWEDENTPIPSSMLATVDPDRLLLLICQESQTLQQWKELETQPEWLNLRAVQRDQVHVLHSDPWRDRSPEAYKRMVDDAGNIFCGSR